MKPVDDYLPFRTATVLDSLAKLPAMPVAAASVIRLLNRGEGDAAGLAAAVACDPVLAARVLQVANSSFYGLARRIRTIQDAVVVLGQKALRNMVLAMAIKGMHSHFGEVEKKLWEEAIGHACAARLVARRCGVCDVEEAFLAGLVCSIGELVCNNQAPDKYLQVLLQQQQQRLSRDALAPAQFDFSFSQIGASVLYHWKLAPEIVLATLFSCQPDLPADLEPTATALAHTVFFARCLCCNLALGNYHSPCQDLQQALQRSRLPLPADELQDFVASLAEQLRESTAALANA
jgi:HD-like signal output (HDOD) protein